MEGQREGVKGVRAAATSVTVPAAASRVKGAREVGDREVRGVETLETLAAIVLAMVQMKQARPLLVIPVIQLAPRVTRDEATLVMKGAATGGGGGGCE